MSTSKKRRKERESHPHVNKYEKGSKADEVKKQRESGQTSLPSSRDKSPTDSSLISKLGAESFSDEDKKEMESDYEHFINHNCLTPEDAIRKIQEYMIDRRYFPRY